MHAFTHLSVPRTCYSIELSKATIVSDSIMSMLPSIDNLHALWYTSIANLQCPEFGHYSVLALLSI